MKSNSSSSQGTFVDPMLKIASVLSVSHPCMSGGGTDNDEDFCGGGCGRRLSAQEKKIGLCSRCQKKDIGDTEDAVSSLFMPTMELVFAPAPPSSLVMLTSISPQFAPQMAKKRCPDGDGDKLKASDYPRGWKCSNPKCRYAKYG
ncbi:MAG: hypothetical protein WC851_02630 [Candidatus Shapirobacteria bacterium]|jgi:hypothetical protein